jgi:hypothetical protein
VIVSDSLSFVDVFLKKMPEIVIQNNLSAGDAVLTCLGATLSLSEISGSHSDEHEDGYFLGCCTA